MTEQQAKGMLAFRQRIARAARKEAEKAENKRHRAKLLRDAEIADRRAADCQAVVQIARRGREYASAEG
jgi:hypothetical protein